MKKILMVLFLLILVSCSNTANLEVYKCTKELNEPNKVDREINITSKDNVILKIETSDKFYFNEDFKKETFIQLEKDMSLRHMDSKNISFESEILEDYAIMSVTLKNINDASVIELMMVGLTKEEEELLPGLQETITINKKAGYECILINE